ncbi:hypothetical protein ACK36G_18640 [Aeromonas veronii]|uniref:hypothetical protein n=1 Tax=Aeromonas TaxID=642 RepID=UPI002B2FED37|nr:hypothetical protein VAWG002_43070 [Aeromonas veronii]
MNRIKATLLTAAIGLASLTGCASNGDASHTAALKQPEVLISAPQSTVKAVISERLARAGYQFEAESSHTMAFARPITDLDRKMALVLKGISAEAEKEDFIEFTLLESEGKTTVIGRHFIRVSNAFGQSKKILTSDQNPSNSVMNDSLKNVKNQAEKEA